MDIDLSQSDLSRLTTMLTKVGAAFSRCYGPVGRRLIEIGNVTFEFERAGELVDVDVAAPEED